MSLKLHPRTTIVEKADSELSRLLLDLVKKHDLTYGEIFALISRQISEYAKYQIRTERHPDDPEKKGDEA